MYRRQNRERIGRTKLRELRGAPIIGIVVALSIGLAGACSGTSTRLAEPSSSIQTTPSTEAPTSTTTSSTTTTTTLPSHAGMAASVAFLDTCVSGEGMTGPCRCALDAIADVVPEADWPVMEDRLALDGDLPPVVAEALVGCRAAPDPAFDVESIDDLVSTCEADGVDRVVCRCAAIRAWQIVPPALLGDYSGSTEADPGFGDLVAACRI